nr:MAG TPA: hypothetical protein [Caudoviricetes sp.]
MILTRSPLLYLLSGSYFIVFILSISYFLDDYYNSN